MEKLDQIPKKAGRRIKKHELLAGAAIFLFVLLHFVSPFIFIRDENPASEITLLKTENIENKQTAPIETEDKTEYKIENKAEHKQKSEKIIKTPAPPAPVVQPAAVQPKVAHRPMPKKKEPPRESRAERLRRAERILTGV